MMGVSWEPTTPPPHSPTTPNTTHPTTIHPPTHPMIHPNTTIPQPTPPPPTHHLPTTHPPHDPSHNHPPHNLPHNPPTMEKKWSLKGLSYSYFNVFEILILSLYVLPLHWYIPKIKNSDGGSTLISDILNQIVISAFSLQILRKFPSFVFFTTKSL